MLQGGALWRAADQTQTARNIGTGALLQIEALARLLRDRIADEPDRPGMARDAELVLIAMARLAGEAGSDLDLCLSDALAELSFPIPAAARGAA